MSRYFQINRAAYLEKKRIDKIWDGLPDEDRTTLNVLEREMQERAEFVLGEDMQRPLTGLGHIGFLELLNKVALWRKSVKTGGKTAGQLASMHVVTEALKDVAAAEDD